MIEIPSITIFSAAQQYLDSIRLARSENTARTYQNAFPVYFQALQDHDINPASTAVQDLPDESISWLIIQLRYFAPSTERLYLTAIVGFFEYLDAERLNQPNLMRIRRLIRQRARKPGQRLPQFPQDKIEALIVYSINLIDSAVDDDAEKLRNLRDRAFLVTLADTGLRVHEACRLLRGDLDWNEGKAMIIGKGNRQAIVRISRRAMNCLRDYLSLRSVYDSASHKPLASLPLFARHDRGAGKKVKPITTTTGRNIVSERVSECLGTEYIGVITPHSFRHYFVTTVLKSSGGNLKLAQELARHQNIAVTQRYAHLSDDDLDQAYWEMFSEGN
jgi:site-specific recombinase XerD